MFLDQLMFINRDQLPFPDNELTTDHGVIHIDGMPKDDRGNGIVHTGKADPIQIDGEEVRALATFQTAYIISSKNCRPATRAKM